MYNITCYLGNTLTLVKRGCLCSSHFTAMLVVYPSVSTDGLVRTAGVCTIPMCETTTPQGGIYTMKGIRSKECKTFWKGGGGEWEGPYPQTGG